MSSEPEQLGYLAQARNAMRRFQYQHGQKLTPFDTLAINSNFRFALEKDDGLGQQALHYAQDLIERWAPWKQ